ncbi:hypothetical protein ACSL103130_01730 [Actinomyces slackii]|uniref:Uncharacterized protein n=1 Tax=Actinomyces slackii TaxID=52774 RepID=A0A448KAN8_9ACTO|nr:hypothetical protein [Actinomyces slackii]VEG73989.1 Uncharacterised protein [Actinomyces slackii]
MSEYLAGPGRHADPQRPADEREHVRFGIPFNGVVPIWHDDATITWHRPTDGTDLATVLGMGLVETEPGPTQAPDGWAEHVETGTLTEGGRVLLLRAATPTGRRAINDPGEGAPVVLDEPLGFQEAMEGDFDIVGFGIHIGRIMLRAARDGGIVVFTLRAPRDPEPHHLLSMPASSDEEGVMSFHLGTLLEMEGGAWDAARHSEGMAMLDLTVPYTDLVADFGQEGEEGLDADRVLEMAQPAVQCLLKPGFPFALGASILLPED